MIIENVSAAMREIASDVVLPRFRRLEAGDVEEKSPGEIVSIVDREVELALGPRLLEFLPGSRVVGEEAVSEKADLLENLNTGMVWLVDPLDGTSNFVAGSDDFAMMVALLRDGVAVGSWILSPISERLAVAEAGGGAYVDGRRINVATTGTEGVRGVIKTRFLPPEFKAALEPGSAGAFPFADGSGSAGIDYPALVNGHWAFLLYWRTLAWDHVPGSLFVTEAGGHVARLDGSAYRASDPRCGLLAAPCRDSWHAARMHLPI